MQIFELFGTILLKDSGTSKQLDDIDKKASSTDKSMGSAFGRIGGAAMKLGAILGTGLGIKGLIEKSYEFATSASDLVEAQNVVETTFKNSSKAIEDWTSTTAKSAGISKTASTQWVGFMGAMLKSSGVSEDSSASMSKNLVQLTGDMSSFYNVSTSDMWEKLRSGISGETEPLKQIGINMSVANLAAFALSTGIKTAYKDMSQSEQTTLRYNYLMKVTADAQGDFGKTLSTSFANQVRVAKLNMEDLGRSIGTKLLPYFMQGSTWINDNMPKIQAVITKTMNGIVDAVKYVIPKFQEWIDLIGQIAKDLLPDFGKSTDDAGTKATDLAKNGLDLVTACLTWIRDNIGLVKTGIEALTIVWVLHKVAVLANNVAMGAHEILQAAKMIRDKAETLYLWLLIAADKAYEIAVIAGSAALKVITAAQWLFNAAMDANPIGVIVLALAALGLAIYEVVKHWQDICDWIEKAWNLLNKWNTTKIQDKTSTVKLITPNTSGKAEIYTGGFASGTDYAAPGAHWVGENGPELLNFKGGETVTNAEDSKKLAMENSKTTTSKPTVVQLVLQNGAKIAEWLIPDIDKGNGIIVQSNARGQGV